MPPEMQWEHILAIAAAWGAGVAGGYAFVDFLRQARRAREFAREEILVTETRSVFLRFFMPLARFIGRGLRGTFSNRRRDDSPGVYQMIVRRVDSRLASAGRPEGLDADEYVGFGVLCTLLGGAAGAAVFVVAPMTNVGVLFLGGALVGALRMPTWLNAQTQARHNRIRKELPFALDLFTLATEAGLDFVSALDRIVRKLGRSPLGEELQLMLREIRLGKTRSDAMRDMGRRVDVPEVVSVMTSLVQAEEMGANIGPVLRIQADQQRERRSQRAEEAAGKVPVKLLFPLMFIMMVTFMIIFGPMVVTFIWT